MDVGNQALTYWLHGARNWLSKMRSNHLVIKPDWLSTAGDNWYRMGIIPDQNHAFSGRHLTRFVGSLITFSCMVRFGLGLRFDSFTDASLQFALGDHLAFVVAGHAAWLYFTAAHLFMSLYGLLFYLFFQTNLSLTWFGLFDQMKKEGVHAFSNVTDVALRKKCFIVFAVVFKHVFPLLHFSIFIYSFAIVNKSLRLASSMTEALLALLWGAHYLFCFALPLGLLSCLNAIYFSLFCLFASSSVASVTKEVKKISQMTKSFCPLASHHKILKRQFDTLYETVRMIRSCNRYFDQNLRLFVPILTACLLSFVYGLSGSETVSEFLAFFCGIIFIPFMISLLFLMSAMLTKKLSCFYKECHSLQQKRWRVGTKLHLLSLIELLASRRHRVGFRLKHWCTLDQMNLFKVFF